MTTFNAIALLLPRPQRHRRLAGLEPELHQPLAPDGHEVEPWLQFLGAGLNGWTSKPC